MFYFADSKVGVSLLYLGGMNGECVSFTVSFFPPSRAWSVSEIARLDKDKDRIQD